MNAVRILQTLTLSCAMAMSLSTSAQVDRSKPPVPGPPPEVRIGEHQTYLLKNGMRVIVVEDHKLPLVNLQVKFDIDPILQGDKTGYIDLVGELLASGTARKTKEMIDQEVDGAGATLSTTHDGFTISVLKKNLRPMMTLTYEILASASFPPAEFEKAKTRAASALTSRRDDPDAIADEVASALTYSKGHPYGEVVTENTLANVDRKHVITYYQRFFQPESAYLVLVGDIDEKEAKEWTDKFFDKWEGAPYSSIVNENGIEEVDGLGPVRRVTKKPRPHKARRMALVDRPGAPQSVIRVLFPVDLAPNSPDMASVSVMSNILGGGVFNARLMQNLREDKAYTYGARSSIRADKHIGRFVASASVRTEVTDSAVTEFMFEIENMRQTNVSQEELEVAKNFLAGSFARSLEDPRTIAQFALSTYLHDLPADHYTDYLKRLDAVTIEDVRKAAEKYLFPDNAVVLVVGDKDEVSNKLVPLSFENSVVQYDMNGDVYRASAALASPAGLTPQQVVATYIEAIGGEPKLRKVKDIAQEFSANVDGTNLTMSTWKTQDGKYASETKLGSNVLSKVVFDGSSGARIDAEGVAMPVDPDVEEIGLESQIFPELHYQGSMLGVRMTLLGITEVEGKQSYKVALRTNNGNIMYDHYDVKTGLKLRRSEMQRTNEGNFNVVIDFKDYREVDGILFPHLVQQTAQMNLSFVLESTTINKGIDTGRFNLQ